jgi:hypothetical protein
MSVGEDTPESNSSTKIHCPFVNAAVKYKAKLIFSCFVFINCVRKNCHNCLIENWVHLNFYLAFIKIELAHQT